MKAMIMAGGEGTRLRPMTCGCPKPMLPLMDRPVMEYALRLLKKHGVREAGVTLMYLPERVREYFGDGEEYGLSLRYYVEKHPLGTAGSVRQAAEFLDETFVVLSGDGATDCDLTAALAFHREKGALATLVLKHMDQPLEYGVVSADAQGRVRRFVEKPGWDEVCSDTVNTGIYILEPEALRMIPEGQAYDFSKQLFPEMLRQGLPLYAYTMEGYWCDIGDTGSYLRAHMDALDGKLKLDEVKPGVVNRARSAQVDRSAVVEAPCVIGEGAQIGPGARIGAYSVIGARCVVEENASVKRSVLMEGAGLGAGTQVRGAVLMPESRMLAESSAFEESVLGERAVLGTRAVLPPGIRIWPEKRVPDGMKLERNLVWGEVKREQFRGDELCLERLEDCPGAIRAYVRAVGPRSVLLSCERAAMAEVWLQAVRAALMSCGVQVVLCGGGLLPQTRFTQRAVGALGGCFVSPGRLRFLDEDGIELGQGARRAIEGYLQRDGAAQLPRRVCRRAVSIHGANLYYLGIYRELRLEREKQVAVCASDEGLLELAESACRQCGCLTRAEWEEELMDLGPDETGVWLSEDGASCRLAGAEGGLSEAEQELILDWALLENGEKELAVGAGATHAVELLAERYDAQVLRVRSERACLLRAAHEQGFRQFTARTDGLYAALLVLQALSRRNLTLGEWLAQAPLLKRRVKKLPLEYSARGRVLSALALDEEQADFTEGLCAGREDGWAWVHPESDRPECVIVGEAADMETADELCNLYFDKVVRALGSAGQCPVPLAAAGRNTKSAAID